MKRHLEEGELEQLSIEDHRLILTEQFETHRRLREQAQSIIRMIISGVGIIVALLGYKLYPDFQLPSRTVTAAGGNLEFNGLLQGVAENSLFVALLFVMLAGGLLFFSVVKSITVLSSDGPIPLSRHKSIDREPKSETTEDSGGKLVEWILTNDIRIVEAERHVEQSYTHIWASFFAAGVAITLGSVAIAGWLRAMGVINFILVVGGPFVLLYYLRDTLKTLLRKAREGEYRSAISDSGVVFADMMHHRGLDSSMKISLIIFYGVYFDYSLTAAYVWLTLFVF